MDNIKAALLGVAIGDALGATVEFMTKEEIKRKYGVHQEIIGGGWLNLKPGEVTDDTQMTLAVARGIVADPKQFPRDHIGQEFVKWYRTDPKDIGGTCRRGIEEYIRTGKWQDEIYTEYQDNQGGNGALMRCIYPALFYDDMGTACYIAKMQGRMTHFSIQSDNAISTYASFVYGMIDTAPEERMKRAKSWLERLDISQNELNPTGYVVDSFKVAMWHILNSDCFEDAVVGSVNEGGDADTIGAIAGGLAGAIWGMEDIPMKWIRRLDLKVQEEIVMLAGYAECNRKI